MQPESITFTSMESRKIGVISDTHGLLRPEAIHALQGVELILHAGDVGTPEILEALSEIAPVKVVRGNVDKGDWAMLLPTTVALEFAGKYIYMVHDREDLDLDPGAAEMDMVIFGHSHKPLIDEKAGVIWFNPGSAGKRRFSLPVSLGFVEIRGDQIKAHWLELV